MKNSVSLTLVVNTFHILPSLLKSCKGKGPACHPGNQNLGLTEFFFIKLIEFKLMFYDKNKTNKTCLAFKVIVLCRANSQKKICDKSCFLSTHPSQKSHLSSEQTLSLPEEACWKLTLLVCRMKYSIYRGIWFVRGI